VADSVAQEPDTPEGAAHRPEERRTSGVSSQWARVRRVEHPAHEGAEARTDDATDGR
jgi:hypothetical protein